MVFTILIAIVFIAELIIAFTIIWNLVKFDKMLINLDNVIEKAKPEIKSIAELVRKISEQVLELTGVYIDRLKEGGKKILLKNAESLIAGILFWGINIKLAKKFKKSKFFKTAQKGFALIQNVI